MSLLAGPRRSTETRSDHPTNSLAELLRRREPAVTAGEYVDVDSAGRHGAVFACRDLIARMISTLPVHEYDRQGEGGALRQLPTPAVLSLPDGELEFEAWLYQAIYSALSAGNAYALVQAYDRGGWPSLVTTVHPSDVGWSRRGKYGPVDWTLEGQEIRKWPAGDLLHMPAYLIPGCPVGVSPITYAALTIGVGLGAQRFSAQWLRDGMVPAGLLTNEEEVPQPLADLVKEMWRDALMGNREPVVLGDGWKYDQVSVAPNESQFLETIQANKADVAMFFGLDPEAIGATRAGGSSVVYQNVEQSEIHLMVRTLNAWMVRVEKWLTRIRPRPRFVKLNPDAILRVDAKTRAQVNDIQVRGGTAMPDEVRELEDRPPLPNGKGKRALWPPNRMQLDEYELKLGADTDPAKEPLPPPPPALPPAPEPAKDPKGEAYPYEPSDEDDDEDEAGDTDGQSGGT